MKPKYLWIMVVLVSVLTGPASVFAKDPPPAPLHALKHTTAWLNSNPLSAADLRGKVVLVDFWTYTCINWRRTLPWLRAWDQKYRSAGLVVLGIHTPEISFEKDLDNVRTVARQQDVSYPIALDNDYAIWNAFRNQYWPALYIVDAQGRIREERFGEGDYDRLETLIRQLLADAGHPVSSSVVPVRGEGAEAAADWKNLRTPESYVGHTRAESFASIGGAVPDRARVYAAPASLKLNRWALSGSWTMKSELVVSQKANGRIAFRFHARDVHAVMGPEPRGKPIRFRVTIDGRAPDSSHGLDVDADGIGTLVEPRMYQIIRQSEPVADRTVEIEFLDAGAQVYNFTFG